MFCFADDGSPLLLSTKENEGIVWNLRKDDLTQQSEEAIDFIHLLISQPNLHFWHQRHVIPFMTERSFWV
jgi:hypothetical protein